MDNSERFDRIYWRLEVDLRNGNGVTRDGFKKCCWRRSSCKLRLVNELILKRIKGAAMARGDVFVILSVFHEL